MKILMASAGSLLGVFGGGQTYVQSLAIALRERGHDVVLLTPADSQECCEGEPWRLKFQGMPVIRAFQAFNDGGRDWEMRSSMFLDKLRTIVRETGPDIIHMNGWKSHLSTIANECSVPHVATAHHPGVACPIGTLLRPDESLCDIAANSVACVRCACRQRRWGATLGRVLGSVPRRLYGPVGQWVAACKPSYLPRCLGLPHAIEQSIEDRQVALLQVHHWIAPSQAIRDVLIRNGVNSNRIQVVPHGIEPLPRAPFRGLVGRSLRFGYVGAINYPKGLHVLLEAFWRTRRRVDCELHVFGAPQNSSEESYFRNLLSSRRNQGVRWHGYVGRAGILAALDQFDVFVHPAILLEVFGLALAEALSAGRPAIVTDSGGPAERIAHGVNGLIVPRNDVDALVDAMLLLAKDSNRVVEMSARIGPVRTLREHVDEVEDIYERIVGSSKSVCVNETRVRGC